MRFRKFEFIVTLIWAGIAGAAAGSAGASGGDVVVLFGGNDYQPDTNMFTHGISDNIQAYREAGWQVLPFFDGSLVRCKDCPPGFKADEEGIAPVARAAGLDPTQVPRASSENLLAKLRGLATAEGAPCLVKKDKPLTRRLLLHIDTHGYKDGAFSVDGAKDPKLNYADPELIHALSDLQNCGVQLGFVVATCFSGTALPAFSRFGCVMTASTADKTSTVSHWKWLKYSDGKSLDSYDYPFTDPLSLALRSSVKGGAKNLNDAFETILMHQAALCMEDGPLLSGFDLPSEAELQVTDERIGRLARGERSCLDDSGSANLEDFESSFAAMEDAVRTTADTDRGIIGVVLPPYFRSHVQELAALEKKQGELDQAAHDWHEKYDQQTMPLEYRFTGPLKELQTAFAATEWGSSYHFDPVTHRASMKIPIGLEVTLFGHTHPPTQQEAQESAERMMIEVEATHLPLGTQSREALKTELAKMIFNAFKSSYNTPANLAAVKSYLPLEKRLADFHTQQTEALAKYHCDLGYLRARAFAEQRKQLLAAKIDELSPEKKLQAEQLRTCENFSLRP